MREVKVKYFLKGERIKRDNIPWERVKDIGIIDGRKAYIYLEDEWERDFSRLAVSNVDIQCDKMEEELKSISPYATGVKNNTFKAPLDILINTQFSKALQLLALATAFGNKKYEETDKDFLNFKRVSGGSQTYFDAAARHNIDRRELDDDSKLPHTIHAVWNMLAALEIFIEEQEIDVKEVTNSYLKRLNDGSI